MGKNLTKSKKTRRHTRVKAADGGEGSDLLGVVKLKWLHQLELVVWCIPITCHV